MELAAWGVLAIAGMLVSALCSGAEAGLYGLRKLRLEARAAAGESRARRLRREVSRPIRLLVALLVCNSAANYAGSLGLGALLGAVFASEWAAIAVNAMVLTPVLFVVGETLPKDLFRSRADVWMYRLAPVLCAMRWSATLSGALPLIVWATGLARRALGDRATPGADSARDRVASVLQEVGSDASSASHGELIELAFSMRRRTVSDVMVPWSRVWRARADWGPDSLRNAISRSPHHRYPVVDGSGLPVGDLDALDVWLSPGAGARDLMRKPLFVSSSTPVLDALLRCRESASTIATVRRRGRPVGLVSVKDLMGPLLDGASGL